MSGLSEGLMRLDSNKSVQLIKRYREERAKGNVWAQMPFEAFEDLHDFDFSRPLPFVLVDEWRSCYSPLFITAKEVAALPVTKRKFKSASLPFVCEYYKQTGRLPDSRAFLIWKALGFELGHFYVAEVVRTEKEFQEWSSSDITERVSIKLSREMEDVSEKGIGLYLGGFTDKPNTYDDLLRTFGIYGVRFHVPFVQSREFLTKGKVSLLLSYEGCYDSFDPEIYEIFRKGINESFLLFLKNSRELHSDTSEWCRFVKQTLKEVREGETWEQYCSRVYGIRNIDTQRFPYVLTKKEAIFVELFTRKGFLKDPGSVNSDYYKYTIIKIVKAVDNDYLVEKTTALLETIPDGTKIEISETNLAELAIGIKLSGWSFSHRNLTDAFKASKEDIDYLKSLGEPLRSEALGCISALKKLKVNADTIKKMKGFFEFLVLHFTSSIPTSYRECENGSEKLLYPLFSKFLSLPEETLSKMVCLLHNYDGHCWTNAMVFMDKIVELLTKSKKPAKEREAGILKLLRFNAAPEIMTKEVKSFITGHLETSSANLELIVEFWDVAKEGTTVKEKLSLINNAERRLRVQTLKERAASFGYTGEPCKTFDLRSDSYKFFDCSVEEDLLEGVSLGNDTHCCQNLEGEAKTCVYHGVFRNDSSFLGIYNETEELVAQSWIWWVGDTLVLDNIELANFQHSEKALERIQEAYHEALRAVAFSNVYIGLGYTKLGISGGIFEERRIDVLLRGSEWEYSDVKYGSKQVKKDGNIFDFSLFYE
ncbi:MAG: hypothetical protein EOM62_11005 [Bacteroidia bacterium]|nr:hypothetical protein [Bacteroidia bacterium]